MITETTRLLLEQDEKQYGISFVQLEQDGSTTRLDPRNIRMCRPKQSLYQIPNYFNLTDIGPDDEQKAAALYYYTADFSELRGMRCTAVQSYVADKLNLSIEVVSITSVPGSDPKQIQVTYKLKPQ
jgi:hypothetical protein